MGLYLAHVFKKALISLFLSARISPSSSVALFSLKLSPITAIKTYKKITYTSILKERWKIKAMNPYYS